MGPEVFRRYDRQEAHSLYGEKWMTWANTRVNTARLSVIPQKFRDRQVIRQEADGEYALNGAIQDWIDRIP